MSSIKELDRAHEKQNMWRITLFLACTRGTKNKAVYQRHLKRKIRNARPRGDVHDRLMMIQFDADQKEVFGDYRKELI